MKRRILVVCSGVGLVVLAGIVAPFLHADRYRGRAENAISAALGRKVTIDGTVTLNLFTGPGLSMSNVRVEEASGGDAEPFAYVDEMTAVPRVWSFWTGRLEFSSLTLNGAHVNLSRGADDQAPQWNVAALMRPGVLAAFPNIRMRDSRINFKIAGRKSTFYLLNVDLDVAPRWRHASEWELRVAGEPARTDRPARGFGAVEARGRWKQTQDGGHTEVDLRLMRSEIGDIVALVYGHDAGVHGIVAGQVHVAGALSALGIEGELRVSELHGWEQSPPSGGAFPFRISGSADVPAQRLELFAEPKSSGAAIRVRLAGEHMLQKAAWQFETGSEALPLTGIAGLLRNFGAQVPDGTRVTGALDSGLRYATGSGWTGSARLRDAKIVSARGPEITFASAEVTIADDVATLEPAAVLADAAPVGELAGRYAMRDGSFEIDLTSDGPSVPSILHTFPGVAAPLLSEISSGYWKGELGYRQSAGGQPVWTGDGLLTHAEMNLPELAQPVEVTSARVRLDGATVEMDHLAFEAGGIAGTGDYRYVPGAANPHQFHLAMGSVDGARLESLLQPALGRKTSLIDLALSLGRAQTPAWLAGLHAEGTAQARVLTAGGVEWRQVRCHVQWRGTDISLPDLTARDGTTALRAKLVMDLSRDTPHYTAVAEVKDFDWQGGVVNGTVRAQTSGTGTALLKNLRLSGTFNAQALTVPPLGELDTAAGEYVAEWQGPVASVRFPQLQLVNASGDTWTGSGAPGGTPGEVVLRLSNHGRQINLAGSLTDARQNWVELAVDQSR